MRPVIELVPHVGVGALRFGMHRDEVRRIVGIAPYRGARWVETFGPAGGSTWFAVYDDDAIVTEIGRHPSFDPFEMPPEARVGLSRTELWRIAGRPSVPRVPNDLFLSNGAMLGAHYDDTFRVRELVVQGIYDAVLGVFICSPSRRTTCSRACRARSPPPTPSATADAFRASHRSG